jgi:polar amino acid transport system substrate-binding protein
MKTKIAVFTMTIAMILCSVMTASADSVLEGILKKKELRIGTSGQQPPMTVVSKTGEVIGLDADIGNAMAAAMGVKAKFVTMPFGDLLPALEAGNVDMVISGMTMTPERNLSFAFVGPYYISGKGILAKLQKFAELKEADGLNTPEVRIAAMKNSTSQEYAEKMMPKAQLILTDSYEDAIALLFDSKIEVLVADYPFCALSAYRHHDKNLVAGQSPLTFEPLGIALPADTLLINWVRNFLLLINGNGDLKKMQTQWSGGGTWVDQLP